MTWVRLDDAVALHRKQLAAGPEACWLWVAGLAYANRLHTDGVLHDSILPALYPSGDWSRAKIARLSTRLVEVGLWARDGDTHVIHQYAEYQEEALRELAEEKRAHDRERKREYRRRKSRQSAPNDSREIGRMSQGDASGTNVGHVPRVPAPRPGPARPVPSREEICPSVDPPEHPDPQEIFDAYRFGWPLQTNPPSTSLFDPVWEEIAVWCLGQAQRDAITTREVIERALRAFWADEWSKGTGYLPKALLRGLTRFYATATGDNARDDVDELEEQLNRANQTGQHALADQLEQEIQRRLRAKGIRS